MKKWILYLLLGFMIGLYACNDEDALKPSDEDIYGYFVPQGDHDYDDRIVDWKDRCNFFILYKWSPRDLYWRPSRWDEAVENDSSALYPWTQGYKGEPADEEYVGLQLDLLEEVLFGFYPDSTLRRCMPLKILLCEKLESIQQTGTVTALDLYEGYDLLAFSYGSESVLTLTAAKKNDLKLAYNQAFLLRLKSNGKIPTSELFYSYSDYSTNVTASNFYERGYVYYTNSDKTNTDWQHYLRAIISTSYEDLTREVPASDRTYNGILNDMKDTKGLIKKKYAAITNHFKEYGIDLQKIGNTKIE